MNLNFVNFRWNEISRGSTSNTHTHNATISDTSLLFDNSSGAGKVYLSPMLEVVNMVVVLFPSLDTISVFPLIAITLSNNLAASAMGKQSNTQTKKGLCSWRFQIVLWRLLAGVPPIFASVILTDLSLTLQFSGIAGIYIAFIAPLLVSCVLTFARVAFRTICSLCFVIICLFSCIYTVGGQL